MEFISGQIKKWVDYTFDMSQNFIYAIYGPDKILSGPDIVLIGAEYNFHIWPISGPDMEFIYLAILAQTYLARSGPDMVYVWTISASDMNHSWTFSPHSS